MSGKKFLVCLRLHLLHHRLQLQPPSGQNPPPLQSGLQPHPYLSLPQVSIRHQSHSSNFNIYKYLTEKYSVILLSLWRNKRLLATKGMSQSQKTLICKEVLLRRVWTSTFLLERIFPEGPAV